MGEKNFTLVVGSQNANEADRFLERSQIKSVQLLKGNNQFEAIKFFNQIGELGISSICWTKEEPLIWYYTTGNELFELDLIDGIVQSIHIPRVKGIHEIKVINGLLWISNTFFDEVIAYGIKERKVIKRVRLQSSSENVKAISEADVDPKNLDRQNKFHCNQVFEDYEGNLVALVHHVNGEQIINRVAQRLIKNQGNGGVLFIEGGKTKRLRLKAPHSVRLVNNQYWIFDSGHAQLNVYSRSWDLIKEISMAGWGRGGDYSNYREEYIAGVSAKRKRYLAFNEENKEANMLQAFDLNFQLKWECEVPNVEQINNVYVISKEQLERIKEIG